VRINGENVVVVVVVVLVQSRHIRLQRQVRLAMISSVLRSDWVSSTKTGPRWTLSARPKNRPQRHSLQLRRNMRTL